MKIIYINNKPTKAGKKLNFFQCIMKLTKTAGVCLSVSGDLFGENKLLPLTVGRVYRNFTQVWEAILHSENTQVKVKKDSSRYIFHKNVTEVNAVTTQLCAWVIKHLRFVLNNFLEHYLYDDIILINFNPVASLFSWFPPEEVLHLFLHAWPFPKDSVSPLSLGAFLK